MQNLLLIRFACQTKYKNTSMMFSNKNIQVSVLEVYPSDGRLLKSRCIYIANESVKIWYGV